MYTKKLINKLKDKSYKTRRKILDIIYKVKSGHIGGSFSAVEILVSLYYHHMNINADNPTWEERDRFILSKGHAAPLVYVILADLGYFSEEELNTFRQVDSILQGHPDMKKTPGIEMTSGSLGQGLSIGIGLSLSAKSSNNAFYTYVLMGDGELNEGQIWEAVMFANKEKLNKLIGIVDYNGVQLDGSCNDIMPLNSIKEKFKAFGWRVLEINGHNFKEILNALDHANQITENPVVIIADTIKGKGVSFMENDHKWHGQSPSQLQYQEAIKELEKRGK